MRVARAAVGTPLVRMVPIAVVRMVPIAVVRMVPVAVVRMVPIAVVKMVSIAVVGMFSMSVAAQQPAPTQPPAQPGTVTQTPGAPQTPGQPPGVQPPASTPAPQPRVFTAPAGLLINTVRPDRVDDFEKAMGYLQAALASSTNERVREQAAGWRVFKATETGPNNAVLYVFMLDPTVPGADYSLGRILADAYPDQAKLQEIWKLYSGSVTGGHLLNLTPLKPAEPLKIP